MTGAGDGAAGLLDESQPENRTRTTTVTARTDTRASGNMASRMLPPRHHGEDPAFALRATADKRRACQPCPRCVSWRGRRLVPGVGIEPTRRFRGPGF